MLLENDFRNKKAECITGVYYTPSHKTCFSGNNDLTKLFFFCSVFNLSLGFHICPMVKKYYSLKEVVRMCD